MSCQLPVLEGGRFCAQDMVYFSELTRNFLNRSGTNFLTVACLRRRLAACGPQRPLSHLIPNAEPESLGEALVMVDLACGVGCVKSAPKRFYFMGRVG